VDDPPPLPQPGALGPGDTLRHRDETYHVTVVTRARYRGVEGELPFEYWDKREITFADLRTETARFATVDYSESPPLFFAGEFVEFDALRMAGLREFDGWPAPR
jgi:hypothetical protein